MKNTTGRWVVASAAVLVLVLGFALPQIPPPKARAARIHAVNHLAHPFPEGALVLTNVVVTNAMGARGAEQRRSV